MGSVPYSSQKKAQRFPVFPVFPILSATDHGKLWFHSILRKWIKRKIRRKNAKMARLLMKPNHFLACSLYFSILFSVGINNTKQNIARVRRRICLLSTATLFALFFFLYIKHFPLLLNCLCRCSFPRYHLLRHRF